MRNFIDELIEICKEKREERTREVCNDVDAMNYLHEIFSKSGITKSNKYKVINGYEKNAQYRISRGHAIALGITFGFNLVELNAFLAKAGYYLSACHQPDQLIIDKVSKAKCTVDDINAALEEQNFPLLTSRSQKKSG